MSPPCQPFTRNGKHGDTRDGRTAGFMALLAKLPRLAPPPRSRLERALRRGAWAPAPAEPERGRLRELPDARGADGPAAAVRVLRAGVRAEPHAAGRALLSPALLPARLRGAAPGPHRCARRPAPRGAAARQCRRLGAGNLVRHTLAVADAAAAAAAAAWEYLETVSEAETAPQGMPEGPPCADLDERSDGSDGERQARSAGRGDGAGGADTSSSPAASSVRPTQAALLKWWRALDLVCASDTRCCCFTKSYSRYLKGAGSLLCDRPPASFRRSVANERAHGQRPQACPPPLEKGLDCRDPAERSAEQHASGRLKRAILPLEPGAERAVGSRPSATEEEETRLSLASIRYFTPREVANLHAFPKSFSFPSDVSKRQRYALLGNSLSVDVVACLLQYLLSAPPAAAS
eukprot:scaffold55_cov401-Prasinococcus_capsulatus_cf.AAC.2